MDYFSDLLLKLCPDSKIAVQFKCKRTKSKCIVQNSLAPHFHKELVKKLRTSHFSFIIDETTDVSTHKELTIVTRVFSGKSVECVLYRLVEVSSCDTESLFQVFVSSFNKDDILLNNITGFAADTTNVTFGEYNSVASRLKEAIPHILLMRCICHSAHL